MVYELTEWNKEGRRLRTNHDITQIYERHADTVYRVCFLFLQGRAMDIEDALQSTFLRLLHDGTRFRGDEHEKAWLIVTASNVCRDMLRSAWKRRVSVHSKLAEPFAVPFDIDETAECVMSLPSHIKTAIYMFYYEGYSAREIGHALGKSENSVWGYLHKGRALLKDMLKEEAP